MTPAERRQLAKSLGGDIEKHKAWVLERYGEMRATVRCMCGYTPEVLRRMSWTELRQAYEDCKRYLGRWRRGETSPNRTQKS